MTKKYEESPIVEVACEFRFPSTTKWDATVAGLFYDKVRDEFSEKDQRRIFVSSLTPHPEGIRHESQSEERAVFLTPEKTAFYQMGNRLLAVNCMKPYPEWPKYFSYIKKGFQALKEIVEIETFERIGIRYINRIEIPEAKVDLDKYFELRPVLGPSLPQEMNQFQMSCFWRFENGRDACKAQFVSVPADKSGCSDFILDLDYFLVVPNKVKCEEGFDWLDTAHYQIETLFEGCINDELRALFKEVN